MIKTISKYSLLLSILCITTSGIKNPQPPKIRMVKITLTENTWKVLFYAMDKSDVPHLTVRALQDSLFSQYNDTILNPIPK